MFLNVADSKIMQKKVVFTLIIGNIGDTYIYCHVRFIDK